MRKNKPGFIESEFQAAVQAAYFNFFSGSNYDFHIPSLRTERDLGYDFKIRKGVPLYIQFKISKFYPVRSTAKCVNDRINFPMPINDVDGTYYFDLHTDRKTRQHDQHNLLFDFGKNSFYVAPLFLKREKLYDLLKRWMKRKGWGDLRIPFIIDFHRNEILNRRLYHTYYLSDCIYLKPHARIYDKKNHKYAFNTLREVSFHSEAKRIEDGVSYLGQHLLSLTNPSYIKDDIQSFAAIANFNADILLKREESIGIESNVEEITILRKSETMKDKKRLLILTMEILSSQFGIVNYIMEV